MSCGFQPAGTTSVCCDPEAQNRTVADHARGTLNPFVLAGCQESCARAPGLWKLGLVDDGDLQISGNAVSAELADKYLGSLLASGEGERPRFRRITPRDRQTELIPGLLYRYELMDRESGNEVVTLSLYLGVGGLGGVLWEQELRTLERLAGFDHPALPPLLDGGRLDGVDGDAGAAFIRTYRKGTPAAWEENREFLSQHRGQALPHLWQLADALAVLHSARISHRGLWPGALSVEMGDDGALATVRLTRFEMSALLANLFRMRKSAGSSVKQLRDLYLSEDPMSRVFMPPERLDFVFGLPDGDLGGPAGDVFSLGMIAADWLLGRDALDGPSETRADVAATQEAVRRALVVRSKELPGSLAQTIVGMLDRSPGGRPTAYEVAKAISAGYADARALLDDDLPDLPYLVGVMPKETDATLYKWGVIQDSATTKDGLRQLTDLVERDMKGAEILHSPTGAEGFAKGAPLEKLRRAKTVVIGPQITWFCERLWIRSDEFDEMMVVKFVRRTEDILHLLQRLRLTGLVRHVPVVEAEPRPQDLDVAQMLCADRPLWSELVEKVESGRTPSEDERDYLGSLEWYLQYQRAQIDARTYAYEIDPTTDPSDGTVTLRWNAHVDRTRPLKQNQLLSARAILDPRRQELAPFVRDSEAGIDLDYGRVRLSEQNLPEWWRKKAEVFEVQEVVDPDTVIISCPRNRRPPERGWLRLEEDSGTEVQLERQADATRELGENRVLLRQLIKPQKSLREVTRPGAGGNLEGSGHEAVQEMLSHDALFALQGPPGTGKTEVTSEAVAEFVHDDPGARVLVSAQSHDALENLAVRICRKLGIIAPPGSAQAPRLDRLALRIESRRSGRDPHPELLSLSPSHMADRVITYSADRARDWLRTRRAERPELTPVVQEWIGTIRRSHPELSRRVRGAASVVFATTGVATRDRLSDEASEEPFDWVVVEEAGRAWPTELALPLVRGLRWTLVGDHAQIGAFDRAGVERFLNDLGAHEDEEVKAMFEARARHLRNFGTFAKLFDGTLKDPPIRVLSEQYRMDPDISGLVGDVFYSASGGLQAMRERAPHPLDQPANFRDHRLVWIDTERRERSVGFWANDLEAELCSRIIRQMEPSSGRPGGPSLAVLTPYRDQLKLLQAHLSEHVARIHTIDGFQGREADVVVASLVRDRLKPGFSPVQTVGHVASPERINVLLSRARELLVIVGRMDVFASAAGPQWAAVVERFRRDGICIPAGEWGEL